METQCSNCRFYDLESERRVFGDAVGADCRRYPPIFKDSEDSISGFPVVFDDCWCGEYQPVPSSPPPPDDDYIEWEEFRAFWHKDYPCALSVRSRKCLAREFMYRGWLRWSELTPSRLKEIKNAGKKTVAQIMAWKEAVMVPKEPQ